MWGKWCLLRSIPLGLPVRGAGPRRFLEGGSQKSLDDMLHGMKRVPALLLLVGLLWTRLAASGAELYALDVLGSPERRSGEAAEEGGASTSGPAATGAITVAVPWWLAFLVLIIAGERLELTRFLPTPAAAQRIFFVIVGAILAGALASFWVESAGLGLFSAGLLALASWLLRYGIARLNARQRGLTRFIAICLLSGYCWLAAAGLLGLAGGFVPGHPWRDATLHAVGLGFVLSMVFGHAPIILPAVARVKIPYHPAFYLPLLALHASLALRVAGVIGGDFALRREGGLANAIALLLFIAAMVTSAILGRRKRSGRAAGDATR